MENRLSSWSWLLSKGTLQILHSHSYSSSCQERTISQALYFCALCPNMTTIMTVNVLHWNTDVYILWLSGKKSDHPPPHPPFSQHTHTHMPVETRACGWCNPGFMMQNILKMVEKVEKKEKKKEKNEVCLCRVTAGPRPHLWGLMSSSLSSPHFGEGSSGLQN